MHTYISGGPCIAPSSHSRSSHCSPCRFHPSPIGRMQFFFVVVIVVCVCVLRLDADGNATRNKCIQKFAVQVKFRKRQRETMSVSNEYGLID